VLVGLQQETIRQGGWILEGRDTTTVVAPGADLKVFLTASIEERARRRWAEIEARGESKRLQDVVKDVVERDHRDYTRDDSPLALAEDAVIVETFGLTPEEVAERIVSINPALFSGSGPSEY
jgi:cytidylate kinase